LSKSISWWPGAISIVSEVCILIPYISPEFLAAVLGQEGSIAPDRPTSPKSTGEESILVLRTQAAAYVKSERAPLQWNEFWLRRFRLLLAVAARLIFWFL